MWPKVIFLVSNGHRRPDLRGGDVDHPRPDARSDQATQSGRRRQAPDSRGWHTERSGRPRRDKVERFRRRRTCLAMLFLAMFAFNLLVMALDFPRFSLVAVILAILFVLFFVLWLGSYFQLDLMKPIHCDFQRHLRRGQQGLLYHGLRDLDVGLRGHLRHPLAGLLGDPAQRDPAPPRAAHRPRAVPDHEPEVRQGDPRRPRVGHARRGPAGAARPQRLQGAGARQRAVHQRQGRSAQEA